MGRRFFEVIPHSQVLGLEVIDAGDQWIEARLPYADHLVGDPDRAILHGGVITTLIDQTSGAAAALSMDPPEVVATLDLRVDHMRAADVRRDVIARASCYRLTRSIAFIRCVAYHDDPEDPLAMSMSSFMRASSSHPSMVEAGS